HPARPRGPQADVGGARAPQPGAVSETERSSIDDIIDAYKRDVDVSLIVENLRRSIDERLRGAHADAGVRRGNAPRRANRQRLMTDFKALLRILSGAGVEFIVVEGVAAVLHGASRVTFDLDVVYRRTSDNIDRLVLALTPYRPNVPGAPSKF